VTVPPQPADQASTGGTETTTPTKAKHKRHKASALANTDSQGAIAPQSGPVTTGVQPATTLCDADGDGVADPGAPSTCSSGGTTTTTTAAAPATDSQTATDPPPPTD
jgi:hypothetical protein